MYLHLLKFHRLSIIIFIEFLILLVLLLFRKSFHRKANPITLKLGISLSLFSILLVLLNTVISLFLIKRHFSGIATLMDSLKLSIKVLYMMDLSVAEPRSYFAIVFLRSAIILNWAVIISALFLILNPLIYQPLITKNDREKVRQLLKLYGQNPISYVAIEDDKKYFFGSTVQGAIAYTLVGNVAICAGDPLCEEECMTLFLSEFMIYCKQNGLQVCFCQITQRLIGPFKSLGFGVAKYGEECMFDLNKHTLDGSEASRIRQALRRADKLGIKVFEYKPLDERNRDLERQITLASDEWLKSKKSSEMKFMLGSVSLENPLDRRYFIALDTQGDVQGFIVFVPFCGGEGYMADVTRRKTKAPFGVMEKLTIESFEIMKKESVKWGSLGLAPLYNVKNDTEASVINNALNYVYENLNSFYGFKTLCQYKKKYVPTSWEPRYLTFYPKMLTPQVAYAIIKSQNPNGVSEYIFSNIKRLLFKDHKENIHSE
jgi:phosphatidylglycerol lysyltransferase